MNYEYSLSIPSTQDKDEDDYNDAPLFTRSHDSSNRLMKQESDKSIYSVDNPNDPARARVSLVPPGRQRLVLPGCLAYFEASLFATILEDVITQLNLLDECNLELRIFKLKSDMVELLGAKFSVQLPKVTDELNDIDITQLYSEHYKLCKVINDRRLCSGVMKDTYLNLSLENKFDPLVKHRKVVTNRQRYVLQQIEDAARNKISKREATRNLRHHRNRMKSSIYDTNVFVNDLISRIEDFTLQSDVRGRYIDRWQGARYEQNTCRIDNKEAGPSKAITYYRRKCEEEQRVHNEVETLINLQYSEKLNLVEDIMAKYDKDTEAIDLKIQRMRTQFEEQAATELEMEETHAEHEKEMKGWVKFKDERERARQYREKMTKAAIAVQAWWRGLLVRLELGPYKPVKRPPANKDKKKKK